MRPFPRLLLLSSLLSSIAFAQNANESILPPRAPWSGASKALALAADDPWATPFEKSGLSQSPNYADTIAWLERLVAASKDLKMLPLGHTLEGRTLYVVVAARGGAADVTALKANGKPTLFAHAGIHAGEIDGKDAGMMLLRDLTVTGKLGTLLDKANFLFVPVLNADGHERASRYNRINQRGPEVMGWRTNGRNLNLNRDFTKLETRELQALIPFLTQWDPQLYFDIHVTDGIDYQYDITYGFTGPHGFSPNSAKWMGERLRPQVDTALRAKGHVPGNLIFTVDNADLDQGLVGWTPSPRFSNGYGDLRHLPTVLVENHSLKPYDQRVLGTYLLLAHTLEVLGTEGGALRAAIEADRKLRPASLPTAFGADPAGPHKETFLAIAREVVTGPYSGGPVTRWLGKPETIEVPMLELNQPSGLVRRPKGYWISADWPEIAEKLRLHGVQTETTSTARSVDVVQYRMEDVSYDKAPFEGRIRVGGKAVEERGQATFPPGSTWVSTDQPLGDLVVLLLEPVSEDSFWQWGYFLEIMQSTEYFEIYALEPLAAAMAAADPKLEQAFREKLGTDPEFASSPRARLEYFYRRSPYTDQRHRLYPIARVE